MYITLGRSFLVCLVPVLVGIRLFSLGLSPRGLTLSIYSCISVPFVLRRTCLVPFLYLPSRLCLVSFCLTILPSKGASHVSSAVYRFFDLIVVESRYRQYYLRTFY